MDFSPKRCGAHFCPPLILPAKKACFLPPFQGFGHVAHMFFRFLLHRFCVFLHDFCIFSHFFVKFSAWANANWQISGVICCVSWWSSHANFAEFSDLYGWNYPARPLYGWNYPVHPSVRLKLPNTPSSMVEITQHTPCMVEITQHALLYGWNYPALPPVWLKLPNTPSSMVEITQHALKGQKLLAQGNALGIRQSAMRPVRAKALKHT